MTPDQELDAALDRELGPSSRSRAADAWRGFLLVSVIYHRDQRVGRVKGGGTAARLGRAERADCVWPEPGLRAAGAARAAAAGPVLRALARAGAVRDIARLDDWHRELAPVAAAHPGSAWAQLLYGAALFHAHAYHAAEERLSAARALRPRWSWPCVLRGEARLCSEDKPGAIADFRAAARLAPGCAWAWALAARAERFTPEQGRIVADLSRAVRARPRWGAAYTWRGQAKLESGRVRAGLADFARAEALNPTHDRIYVWRGDWRLRQGDPGAALPDLDRAHRLNPHYHITLLARAHARRLTGDLAGAGRDLVACSRMEVATNWVDIPLTSWDSKRIWRVALEDWDAIAARRPDAPEVRTWRGILRLRLDELAGAREDLDAACALKPRDPWPRAWRGQLLRRLGSEDAALRELDLAVAADPDCAWALAWRSRLRAARGETAPALADAEAAIRADRWAFPAYAARAALLLSAGDTRAAIAALEAAQQCDFREWWISPWLARLHGRLGELETALKWVRRSKGYRYDAWAAELRRRLDGGSGTAEALERVSWEDYPSVRAEYEKGPDAAARLEGELEHDPLSANAFAIRGSLRARAGRLKAAAGDLASLRRLSPAHPGTEELTRLLSAALPAARAAA